MLKEYCNEQTIAYNIIKNEIANNKIAHAYLFHCDNDQVATSFVLSFAKTLFCPKNNFSVENCDGCKICHRIDDDNFPELKIIEPDGLWIRKDQLMELQEDFKMKSLEGNKRIYIIKEADKLNPQAANSILKFLEEPEPNIIAILTTTDVHSVLETIISRCQVISLREGKKGIDTTFVNYPNKTLLKIGHIYYRDVEDLENYINDAKNVAKIETIITFVKKYEALKLDVILEIKKLWLDYFTEKSDCIWALDMMVLFYKDVLNYMYHENLEFFDYYSSDIAFVAKFNNTNKIIYKLQKILLAKEKVKYNINANLLMDKLLLELESGDNL